MGDDDGAHGSLASSPPRGEPEIAMEPKAAPVPTYTTPMDPDRRG
jgi:hypothetical protein